MIEILYFLHVNQMFSLLVLVFLGSLIPTCPLLVHFSTWSYPIDCHVYQSSRFGHSHDVVNLVADVLEYFVETLLAVGVIAVRLEVYNCVHVELQAVTLLVHLVAEQPVHVVE